MKRGSSLRFMGTPTECSGFDWMVIAVPPDPLPGGADRLSERRCRLLHRLDDVLIAGAPAQVSGEPFANIGLARIRLVFQQRVRCEQHAGCAVAALQTMLIPEAL